MTLETEPIPCAQCGEYYPPDKMREEQVELEDGTQTSIFLCKRICAPDFWDDIAPGELMRCDHLDIDVRRKYQTCENCASVYEYGVFRSVLDTDYEPPSEAIVCSFCRKKEPERWIAK